MNYLRVVKVGTATILLAIAAMVTAQEETTPSCLLLPHTPVNPEPQLYGAWQTVIPAPGGAAIGRILGMQTVHTVMLPSGKILLISGSSWRNLAPIQYYPFFPNPSPPTGTFVKGEEPFRKNKLETYYQIVNNAAIYDPEQNTFYRIPHPIPVDDPHKADYFSPNDLFCTGQQHLPDGNVLFAGGTQYYYPFRTGHKSTYMFDWKKELTIPWVKVDWRQIPKSENDPWVFSGFMERGRWYSSLLPLLDGRIVLFSGYVGFDEGHQSMHQFEINHLVEFFNPYTFDRSNPQAAWKWVDVKDLPNSPFTVEINPDFKPTPGSTCPDRCKENNKFDAFKLYPHNYLMNDGRIYLTGEGDWISLRTCDTAFMRRTKHTYWATIGGTAEKPTVSFSPGPDRPELITSAGTSFLDPNGGDIIILGGQATSPGTLLPINSDQPTQFAGGRGSRKMERFHKSNSKPLGGYWTLEPDFLGNTPQDDRTMHYATILPTQQILVINGGNYDYYGAVHYPLLLTPIFDRKNALTKYKKDRMSEGIEPRFYHNAAMLLPDARVFISGGNTARATVHTAPVPPANPDREGQPLPDLSLVDIDVYFFNDGPMAKGQKGMLTTPTENWVAEIFTPPYLLIDPHRRAAITKIEPVSVPNYQFSKEIGGKTFFLFHSDQTYNIWLEDLPSKCANGNASLVLIKLPSASHGWDNGQQLVKLQFTVDKSDANKIQIRTPNAKSANIPPAYYMMFYVDCKGKPSIARMVRFDDNAQEP